MRLIPRSSQIAYFNQTVFRSLRLYMNLQMLLFKAFAIMDVVLRHRYWPFSQFMFIASSIPLFLFLSGYL